MRLTTIIFVLLFLGQALHAQYVPNPNEFDTFKTLQMTQGWARTGADKWETKANEIRGIDRFDNYFIVSLRGPGGADYIGIVKEIRQKNNFVYDTYILDYQGYAGKIRKWEDNTVLKFPILKHSTVTKKKGEVVSNADLGLTDLSGLTTSPTQTFVYQFKYLQDTTVKFLFYVESCKDMDNCDILGLNQIQQGNHHLYRYMGRDSLYDYFFYKTVDQYFIDFTDSVLK